MTAAQTTDGSRPGRESRDPVVDAIKGIGIVIIMAGHNDYTGVGGGWVSYLYTFNVAVFFVVAGYTSRLGDRRPLGRALVTKFRQVYLPYLALFAISLFYGHVIVRYVFGDYVIPFALRPTLKALLFGSEWLNSVPTFNFALWFLPVFLLASCVFVLMQRIRRVSL